ncbi:TPA: hypothetical protein H1009_02060 [archaeon]|nr:hypothetical protein [Candidatus Naiadarchaeales archaeon SRR2090153.bin461]
MAIEAYQLIQEAAMAFDSADASLRDYLRTGKANEKVVAQRNLTRARELYKKMQNMILPKQILQSAEERLNDIQQRENLLNPQNVNVMFNKIPENASLEQIRNHFSKALKNPVLADELANAYITNRISHAFVTHK